MAREDKEFTRKLLIFFKYQGQVLCVSIKISKRSKWLHEIVFDTEGWTKSLFFFLSFQKL